MMFLLQFLLGFLINVGFNYIVLLLLIRAKSARMLVVYIFAIIGILWVLFMLAGLGFFLMRGR